MTSLTVNIRFSIKISVNVNSFAVYFSVLLRVQWYDA